MRDVELRKLLCVSESDQLPLWEALCLGGWHIRRAADLVSAKKELLEHRFHTGLLFFSRNDDAFCSEVGEFIEMHAGMEWIGVFPVGAMSSATCRELVINHLFDFHTLPVDPVRLLSTVGHAYGRTQLLQSETSRIEISPANTIVGESAGMQRLLQQIRKVASADEPVLIRGESGTGKELVARAVLQCSTRPDRPFVVVHCGALVPALVQAQLFGYEKGAFTGAQKASRGVIEASSGGTIFLDEIGDLSLDAQSNLLRFLQEKTISRLGSPESLRVNVRVIAATHVNLEEKIERGQFREDLFYRLSVLPLWIPPLRERKQDLDLLTKHFFTKFEQYKRPKLKGFSRKAMQAMHEHDWPGNIRELVNRIRCAMVMAEGRLITPGDLGLNQDLQAWRPMSLEVARVAAEKHAIRASLDRAGKNITRAAHSLGVSRMTLYRLMQKHGIDTGASLP